MRISIIGSGYVGLVTGACLAEKGHSVICVDVDPARVAALNRAEPPFFEAGLADLLARNAGRELTATTDLAAAVAGTEVTFVAVGTPFNGAQIDLTAVLTASREIGSALSHKESYHLVVVKSTVVPTTTDLQVLPALEASSGRRAGRDFGLAMNPEFLSEGEAVNDFMFPDRIVLGGIDQRSVDVLESIYEPFDPVIPRLRTNTRTAEMIKYTSNALLATLISFSNEMANVGAALGGIDAVDVMLGVHFSQYLRGRNCDGLPPIVSFLRAGCGFGGSCLPKDVKAMVAHGATVGIPMRLLDSVIQVNEAQPQRVVTLLRKHWPELSGIRISVLGLAFKPETNDVRESPAFPIVRDLVCLGAVVRAFDPVAVNEARRIIAEPAITYCDSLNSALDDAQAVIVITPWKQFDVLPELLRHRQPAVLFVDCRRTFPKDAFDRYEGIGL